MLKKIALWPLRMIVVLFDTLLRRDFCFGVLLIFVLPMLVYMGGCSLYSRIDQTIFPDLPFSIALGNPEMNDNEKGAYLASALTYQLQRELNSRFGWTPNSVSPLKYLDNRKNRQKGVIFATRMLTSFFAMNFGKFGRASMEDKNLQNVRTQYFAFVDDKWWFPSSVEMYRKGIAGVEKYKDDLRDNKTTFNARSDDIYNLLVAVTGEDFLGSILGLLIQTNQEVSFWELDDQVYYTQGTILVLRDFLTSLAKIHPEIVEKGGKENLQIAFRNMDKICTFDPWVVLGGAHDSMFPDHRGKVSRYLIDLRERINDVAQSMRR